LQNGPLRFASHAVESSSTARQDPRRVVVAFRIEMVLEIIEAFRSHTHPAPIPSLPLQVESAAWEIFFMISSVAPTVEYVHRGSAGLGGTG